MLTRRFPVAAALPVFNDMDRLFNELLSSEGGELSVPFGARPFPPLNVWQDDHSIFVEAELPGFTMDQIDISLVNRDLTLQAARTTECEVEAAEKSFLRRERASGHFSRTLRLPVSVESDHVSAKLTNGILTITLPKASEARARKIAVTVT